MTTAPIFVGIDVAKAQLEVAVRPTGETWTVTPGPESMALRNPDEPSPHWALGPDRWMRRSRTV